MGRVKSFRGAGALLGITSVVAGLAASQLVAALKNGLNNPIISLGNRIIDHVPAPVKAFAIKTFGINDKSVLLISILLVVLVLAVLIGQAFLAGKKIVAYAIVMVMISLAGLAALLDAGSTPLALAPSLVAGAVTILILRFFKARAISVEDENEKVNRREALRIFTFVGVGAVAAISLGKVLRNSAGAQLQRLNIALPKPLKFLPPPPTDPALTIPGLSKLFTPNSEFYRIDTALVIPNISIDTWRLRIDGMVKNSHEYTYSELTSRPIFEMDDTIACVSNDVGGNLVGNARWLGIRLDDLIKEAAPNARADQVMGYSTDGFSAGFPLSILDGRNAMIAFGMNGELLPVSHGFPARIIVPGLYGYVSATKWLTRIEITRFDQKQGYWIPRGWSALGPIKTQSRIDTPRDGSSIKAGNVAIAGVAWAPTRGISRVEVRIGNSPWQDATLGPEVAKTTWRQWWITWPATAGNESISVRATDETGTLQSSKIVDTAPNGAEGFHTIKVQVA